MVPIYKYSAETARYENELTDYRESKRCNIKCKEAIEEAIRTHFDGMHLDTSCVQDIFSKFGYDRTMWVLAATVKNKSFDGRFSNINKGWARTIIPSHLDKYEFDEYAVQSHPAVLNGFIDSVRAEYKALGLLSSEECMKDSYKEDYTNKLLILRPEILNDQSRKPAFQYFYAENGFGCDPNSIGRKVFGTFIADGERSHFSRGDFIGVADKEKLPEWASKRLEAISAPKMKIRIYQINSEKDMKDLEFRDFDFAMSKGGIDPGIYQQVYGGIAYANNLEELFMQCNTGNSPLGFYGHSMSVSDVVEICEGKDSGFVCGNYTLQELTPSQGYQLNDEIYKVGAEPQNYKVEVNPIALDVTEDVVKGKVWKKRHGQLSYLNIRLTLNYPISRKKQFREY